jgi:glyceraldehyde 3-phosphate dehydrogenase
MAIRVGISGFGRIGRLVLRAIVDRDSVHRTWPKAGPALDGCLQVEGRKIQVLSEKEPTRLPWKSLGVELVLEATGKFTDRDGAAAHLAAGARGVLVSSASTTTSSTRTSTPWSASARAPRTASRPWPRC